MCEKPKYLYRYMTANETTLPYLENMINDSMIFYPSPVHFNDPFDSKIIRFFEGIGEQWQQEVRSRVMTRILSDKFEAESGLPNEVCTNIVGSCLKYKNGIISYLQFSEDVLKEYQKIVNDHGILCLTENYDNILMWSHYAQSHKGVCIRLCVEENHPFYSRLKKVKYVNDFGCREIGANINDICQDTLYRKTTNWRYEKEWRIISESGEKCYSFPNRFFDSIYFGCKIDSKIKEYLYNILSEKENIINIYQAFMQPNGPLIGFECIFSREEKNNSTIDWANYKEYF